MLVLAERFLAVPDASLASEAHDGLDEGSGFGRLSYAVLPTVAGASDGDDTLRGERLAGDWLASGVLLRRNGDEVRAMRVVARNGGASGLWA